MKTKQDYMKIALEEAKLAFEANEVPVGAVLVCGNQVIAKAHNQQQIENNALLHAEMMVLQQGMQILKQKYLENCVLYVTLEPCMMCAGAIIHCRVKEVVYGAYDAKMGAVDSMMKAFNFQGINHCPEWYGGILEDECSDILKNFFKKKRGEKND